MNSKKKLPIALTEKQELQRQETINKVLRACADIQAEGGKVTISVLMEYTGLSRSTFAKPHIRGLLSECRYSVGDGMAEVVKRKKVRHAEAIVEKDRQIADLRIVNSELERECELLRGRLLLLMQKQDDLLNVKLGR